MSKPNGWLGARVYREMMDRMPICTVDILFFNAEKDRVLLGLRRRAPYRGRYFSLGGRLFKNETLRAAAVRQARTEAGVAVRAPRLVCGGVLNEINPGSIFRGVNYHAVNVYWGYRLGKSEKLNFQPDDQHSELAWLAVRSPRIHPLVREKIKNTLPKL